MSNEPKIPQSESSDATAPTSWTGVSSVIGETLEDPGATVSTPRPADVTPAHDETPAPANAATPPSTCDDAAPVGSADVVAPLSLDKTPASAPTPPDVGHDQTPAGGAEIVAAPSVAETPVADAPPARLWKVGELKLVIEQGMSVGKEFLISEADMSVGRRDPEQLVNPDIDLFDQEAPNNRYISRRQARLFLRDGQLMLEDLDSSNGTALNGQLVAPHEPRALALNDKVHFGQSVLLRVKAV